MPRKKSRKSTGTGKKIRRRQQQKPPHVFSLKHIPWRYIWVLFIITGILYTLYLDFVVRNRFEGKRWALPAKVYARPLELYSGRLLGKTELINELRLLGYREVLQPDRPGTYTLSGNEILLMTRPFRFWDEKLDTKVLKLTFTDQRITGIYSYTDDRAVDVIRMEPVIIGGVYTSHLEDRLLVKLEQVPKLLIQALQTIEDRNFYTHYGLDFKAIARAMWANLRARSTVQGGSTITQQLVKNLYLSNTRSLWRKANEAVMALLLEWHYDKQEIMEAYLNEVYLGQDKARAIHGFGLASKYYFDLPVDELELYQIAMLVALVRGPSYYDPRRHPQRLKKRRNMILDLLDKYDVVSKAAARQAKLKPLGIVRSKPTAILAHPAFMDLVKRQLRVFYREKDLTSEGLLIFTTLDPIVQNKLELTIKQKITRLDKLKKLQGTLQVATIIANTNNGEVVALVGDRQPMNAGFNRALDAIRPIGSLIKPAIYLTALLDKSNYNVLTKLDDAPLYLKGPAGDVWSPQNYDKVSHGKIPLYKALTYSYNIATVRLGLQLGFEKIEDTLRKLGIKRNIPPYPSMMLGSINMSPFEVTQMYLTFASGGFDIPLQSIREVLTAEGKPLQRFPLKVKQTVAKNTITILNTILQNVTRNGTAKKIARIFGREYTVAGKTGTTDDLRDSWFAGFDSDRLIVAWLGADDNRPIGLTGSSGALNVWIDTVKKLKHDSPLVLEPQTGLQYLSIDNDTGERVQDSCPSAIWLAFEDNDIPQNMSECK